MELKVINALGESCTFCYQSSQRISKTLDVIELYGANTKVRICPTCLMDLQNFLGGNLTLTNPMPMLLWCPECKSRHIDEGEFATKPHHTHACQECGHVWRPAVFSTVGVKFLPGFKN